MKLLDLHMLSEGRDAPLFHATSLRNAEKIIQTDMMKAAGHLKDSGAHIDWYVSFSRSYRAAYSYIEYSDHIDDGIGAIIIFEVDQRRLSQNYKIEPYNDANIHGKNSVVARSIKDQEINEYEERVKGTIKNFSRYLTKIHMDPREIGIALKRNSPLAYHPKLWNTATKRFQNYRAPGEPRW